MYNVKGGAHLTSVSSLSIVELSLQLVTKLPTIIIIRVVGDNETDENAKGLSGKMFPRPFRAHFTAQSRVQVPRDWDASLTLWMPSSV